MAYIDYYQVLGVDKKASQDDIKRDVYKRQVVLSSARKKV